LDISLTFENLLQSADEESVVSARVSVDSMVATHRHTHARHAYHVEGESARVSVDSIDERASVVLRQAAGVCVCVYVCV
jgi:hypothetical protein